MAAGRATAGSLGIAQPYRSRSARPAALHPPRVSVASPVSLAFFAVAETQTKQLWMCTSCGFVYDPDEGDPDGGIPPGTAFEDIPDTWFCPVCGARKSDFELYEE